MGKLMPNTIMNIYALNLFIQFVRLFGLKAYQNLGGYLVPNLVYTYFLIRWFVGNLEKSYGVHLFSHC